MQLSNAAPHRPWVETIPRRCNQTFTGRALACSADSPGSDSARRSRILVQLCVQVGIRGTEETLEHSVELALAMGLRPRLTDQVLRACKKYKCVRRHGTIPLPLLVLLCNFFLPNFPSGGLITSSASSPLCADHLCSIGSAEG